MWRSFGTVLRWLIVAKKAFNARNTSNCSDLDISPDFGVLDGVSAASESCDDDPLRPTQVAFWLQLVV